MKIIFLDVDGPLIPARMYYKNGARCPVTSRFIWDKVAVDMLNHLCEIYGAKIVFNSSHNADGADYLMRHCDHNGLLPEYVHHTVHTTYPLVSLRRLEGISKWLTQHGEGVTHWVVVDDDNVPTDNLVRVLFNVGISLENYTDIVTKLGGNRSVLSL